MRRRAAVAVLAAAVCLGTAFGLGVRAVTTMAAHPGPTKSATATASPRATVAADSPTTTPPASGRPGAASPTAPRGPVDLLITSDDLAAIGWRAPVPQVIASAGVQPVSPCQGDDRPFDGLQAATGRWSGGEPRSRGGEVVGDAATARDAQARALVLYNRHLACDDAGVTVGARHGVEVDGGGVTWFPVTAHGVAGYSCVIRIVNRFAVLYVDATAVTTDQLPNLLRAAADRLR